MSAASKGQYWKARTKKFLEAAGYQVAHLEQVMWVHTPRGRVPVKRDQFASDLLAVNGTDVVFVQVKGGNSARSNLAAARTAFARFAFPAGTKQWVVLWKPRARKPEIVVVSEGPCGTLETNLSAPNGRRRREIIMPLFAAVRHW